MRILFGPENDHRHLPCPAPSGAYEWWYFDALSDDGRYAVVAIFFLGSPMTPYYKAVVDGKFPDPMDWCGVFFTLHEKVGEKWKERAYAYNLYQGGEFHADRPEVTVGSSRMTYDGAGTWSVSVSERGLWRSAVQAELRFEMPSVSRNRARTGSRNADSTHAWVCVAPVCALTARMQVNARSVSFSGDGYHDHNFGDLPLQEVAAWYWARTRLACDDGMARTAILYHLSAYSSPVPQVAALIFDAKGEPVLFEENAVGVESAPLTNAYGLTHPTTVSATSDTGAAGVVLSAAFSFLGGTFSEGPFYRRLPVQISVSAGSMGLSPAWTGTGEGIGEIFVPSRLCGPIASRAIWSRIRRRNKL